MTELLERMAQISETILAADLVYGNEYDLQAGIHRALEQQFIHVEREHRINERDRPDFLVLAGALTSRAYTVCIEVKIDGALSAVLRQLERYAEHEWINGLMLVTTRSKHHRIPSELNGKPLRLVTLVGAGL